MFYTIEDSLIDFTREERDWCAHRLQIPRITHVVTGSIAGDWALLWRTIRTHERVWISVAKLARGDSANVIREFLRFWDPIYTSAMEVEAKQGRVRPEIIAQIADGLWQARERAMRIGLGLSPEGTFYPKIDPKTTRVIHRYRRLRQPPSTVAGESMTTMPDQFLAALDARLSRDGVLTVQACHRGRCFTTSIDLGPIADRVREMIRRYHATVLRGDLQTETVAGLGDWYRSSIRAAARIAHAKAAKKLWVQIQAHHGKIEAGLMTLGPAGTTAAIGLRTGITIEAMLRKARGGSAQAIADVRAVVDLAKKGDPSARQAHHVMKTLNEMQKLKEAKESGEAIGGWLYNRPYRVAAVSPSMVLRGFYNLGVVG